MLILLLDDYFTRGLMPLVLSWIVNSSTRVAPPDGNANRWTGRG